MDERREERRLQRRELRARETEAERRLWDALRNRRLDGWKFRRQHHLGPYVVDFVCLAARVVVEVDGPVHSEQQEYDRYRDEYLRALGYTVLRFENRAVFDHLPQVLERIREALGLGSENATPPVEDEEGMVP